ncbi:protein arginine kinase [Brevibacillus nitrificans]|uniref:Protein-arginine kinase n=1 Tax=Brevibacillus nitrificans TaxID=651560 RepID=A0A3M8CU77_9BACL|nr:protein arginine kinase [Brevibacillus nitrificans]RNB78941.1 protein arginine kinase [Brevibacillus nitrificans]
MSQQQFMQNPWSNWMKGEGPDSDIVISTRLRIARNLRQHPFPLLATDSQGEEVVRKVTEVAESDAMRKRHHLQVLQMDQVNPLEKRVLVEKHLISPHLAEESRKGAVLLSTDESVSIMVNEEDHIRIQVLLPGFRLNEAWEIGTKIDDIFEKNLNYAFDETRGYLTSCPTNVGTGIRASVMLHLPALVMTQQISRILQAINQVGLVVRGIYGEGSEALGNLFQLSNQVTLGMSESDILSNLYGVARQIIEQERVARTYLLEHTRVSLEDRIFRSYGILMYARTVESKEAAQRLSDVRLGIDLGVIPDVSPLVLNELLVTTQPGFLQQHAGQKLTPDQRDERRARLIRERITDRQEHSG